MWKISERINKETRSERKNPGNLREKINERKISEKKKFRKPRFLAGLVRGGVGAMWQRSFVPSAGDAWLGARPTTARR